MKKHTILSVVALSTISFSSFAASIQSMNKNDVTKIFQGNTVTTIPAATINNELIANTFVGYFDKNKMQGKLAAVPNNNQPQTDQGTWVVNNDGAICVTWEHWTNNKPVCMLIYKLANGYLIVNKQNNNFESFVLKDIKVGNQLGS